ncbi:MAG: hypothetical protein KF828_08015 [Anaerolineales bacterium]|nr:hypothetical protein [Anaerolineales bacterium]
MFKDQRNVLGLALILVGIFFTLEQFGLIPDNARALLTTALFVIASLVMFGLFLADRQRWWACMVGFFLAGLAGSALLGLVSPQLAETLSGPIFLGAMGLGFASVFLLQREMWWAIIPAGVMFSLTAVSYLEASNLALPFNPSGLLFIGLGLTFLLLTRVRSNGLGMQWGYYPAVPLLVLGVLLSLGSEAYWSILGPLLLIGAGAWLLLGALRKRA